MKSKTLKLTTSGLLMSVGIILPLAFHMSGTQLGKILLPMHLCVFIGGMLLGSVFGAAIGFLSPLISFMISGSPVMPLLIFIIFELIIYGLMSGLCYNRLKLNVFLSLLISQASGRLGTALLLVILSKVFALSVPPVHSIWLAFLTGLPGIAVQLAFIPALVMLLRKRWIFNDK